VPPRPENRWNFVIFDDGSVTERPLCLFMIFAARGNVIAFQHGAYHIPLWIARPSNGNPVVKQKPYGIIVQKR
jgi:hypothetical protein